MPGPEHTPTTEHTKERQRDIEHIPERFDSTEKTPEESPDAVEKQVERARTEAQQEAVSGREVSKGEYKAKEEPAHRPHHTRQESYKHTMRNVRAELSAPERTFSKVIHAPAVERISDAVGKTIARPDAILSGSISACIFVLALYVMARFYGFELRGSETILAFLVGWALGIVFDIVRGIIRGKRS